ncbi:MAG: SDR family NAD(P)-dependent oxidoreductase, partial [Microcoleaceae cyanobacterium MO_207.B10]|nr:SDR family NAD(P)-dependent oxidoreductase [Microcoleaceae cyanobacterium MO_207.B10]
MISVADKIVLITGASSGIGESCANIFAEAGAKLILVARRQEKLEKLADELTKKFKSKIHLLKLDVR